MRMRFASVQHQLWRSIRQATSERLLSANGSRGVRKMFAKILAASEVDEK